MPEGCMVHLNQESLRNTGLCDSHEKDVIYNQELLNASELLSYRLKCVILIREQM